MIFIFEMPWTFQKFYENTFDTTLCCRATNCSILTRPVPKFIKFSYFIINKTTTFVAKTLRFLIIVIVVTFWNIWVTFWGIDSIIWAAYLYKWKQEILSHVFTISVQKFLPWDNFLLKPTLKLEVFLVYLGICHYNLQMTCPILKMKQKHYNILAYIKNGLVSLLQQLHTYHIVMVLVVYKFLGL